MDGTDVPLCILGDPAYPILQWLMKAYPENPTMAQKQKLFNYRLSRARMVVKNAFGRLKGRWRCLLKRNDSRVSNVIDITTACVVLHNICEIFNDECLEEWATTDDGTQTASAGPSSSSDGVSSAIRDAIALYLHARQ